MSQKHERMTFEVPIHYAAFTQSRRGGDWWTLRNRQYGDAFVFRVGNDLWPNGQPPSPAPHVFRGKRVRITVEIVGDAPPLTEPRAVHER